MATSKAACSSPDHPRIRGEHVDDSWVTGAAAGSSPHTRGARHNFVDVRFEVGIIPAYAGSTGSTCSVERSRTDHPRIRGEHPSSRLRC